MKNLNEMSRIELLILLKSILIRVNKIADELLADSKKQIGTRQLTQAA